MSLHGQEQASTIRLDPELDPRVARDLMVAAYAELALATRRAAAADGGLVPSEARVLAADVMRRLMGPAWDHPTRADLVVMKKRLDVALAFDQAPPDVRSAHDERCLSVVETLRKVRRSGTA